MLPNIFVETVIYFYVDMTYAVSNKFYVPNKGKNTVPKCVKISQTEYIWCAMYNLNLEWRWKMLFCIVTLGVNHILYETVEFFGWV